MEWSSGVQGVQGVGRARLPNDQGLSAEVMMFIGEGCRYACALAEPFLVPPTARRRIGLASRVVVAHYHSPAGVQPREPRPTKCGYLFRLSCRSSCRQGSGMVVMFFLITYQTAHATVSDINFARQFSIKKRLIALFMATIQVASDWASPLA